MKTFYTENSTRIKSFSYEEATLTLRVEFTRGGVYEYFNVPSDVYESLTQAESLGKTFDALVKGVYKFQKIV